MDGSDKRKLLVIGKSVKPRCFRSVASLPVTYKANKNAWMTAAIFQHLVNDFDKCMQAKRTVCLLLDNCSTHKIETAHLKSVELVFLPANTTSSVQPLDQGIIRNFKHYCGQRMLQKVLLMIDADENATATNVAHAISVLDAVNFMSVAWQDVSAETIRNCFFRGFTPDVSDEPFLGFSPKEIPVTLTQAYAEFIGMDDDLEITGEQTDENLCNEVAQSGDADVEEINDLCSPTNKRF